MTIKLSDHLIPYVDTTSGDAIAADIALDKIAWVDGVELVGTSEGGGGGPTGPYIVNVRGHAQASNYANHKLYVPARIEAGHVLLSCFYSDHKTMGAMTINTAGWTQLFNEGTTTAGLVYIGWKISDGTENYLSITTSAAQEGSGFILALANVTNVDASGIFFPGNKTSVAIPDVATLTNSIAIAFWGSDSGYTTSLTINNNFNQEGQLSGGGGNAMAHASKLYGVGSTGSTTGSCAQFDGMFGAMIVLS